MGKKEIVLNGVPAVINYNLDGIYKDKQLIHIGSDENININWQELSYDKVIGSDDSSSFEMFIWNNQVLVDRFGDDYWYFDINDLDSVTIDCDNTQFMNDDNYENIQTNYFILKFKDGEEHEFGGFDDFDDVDLFITCLRNVNANILINEKESFAINRLYSRNEFDYGYLIDNNIFKVLLADKVIVKEISLKDIKEKKIMGNTVVLINNDNKIYEFRNVNDDIITELKNI